MTKPLDLEDVRLARFTSSFDFVERLNVPLRIQFRMQPDSNFARSHAPVRKGAVRLVTRALDRATMT